MIIDFHRDFTKDFKKLPSKIKKKFQERLTLFEKDEFHPILNNHLLRGSYQGYRSINVSGDIRAIYKKNAQNVIFITIGSHSSLYG
ncbi:MAG: type II toxin-antitoxin system mRNA interferase toxin, RelE/StbE family [Candidatus Levybacteria bacterium]|nr:type II toxin-antitoxin system mRNA interferase toxin, RelE/StbE family [Candidatus Levybacteria bacterium]